MATAALTLNGTVQVWLLSLQVWWWWWSLEPTMCPSSKAKVQHSFGDLVKQSFLQEVLAAHSAQFDQISKPIVLARKTSHWLCSFGHCDYYECMQPLVCLQGCHQQRSSKCSSVSCNWIARDFFCTYVGQKA